MIFDDYDKFQSETGLIDDDDRLRQIGATAFVGESESGRFDTALLDRLKEFCALNPQYHIATQTSDSDDGESAELERRAAAQGLDYEAMSEEEHDAFREQEQVWVTTIDNSIRFVNRMDFYLADGNADASLSLIEMSD